MSSDRDMPTMDTAIDTLITRADTLDAEVVVLQGQSTSTVAHAAADAPHAGHELTTNRGVAGGYPVLDSAALVPVAQLGTGTPDGTKFLRDDQTYAAPPSGGALTGNVPLYIWKGGALNFAQATTRFFLALHSTSTTTEADATFAMPIRCRVSELRVKGNANIGGAGQTFTTTVRKGRAGGAMADTAVTCSIASGASAGSDVVHTVDYEIGDLFSVKAVASATTGSTIDFGVTCLITALEGDHAAGSAGIPFVLAQIAAMPAYTATFLGEWTTSGTETLMQIPMSAARVFPRTAMRAFGGDGVGGATINGSLNATLPTPGLPSQTFGVSYITRLESGPVLECAENDLLALEAFGEGFFGTTGAHIDLAFRLQNTDLTKYAPIPCIFNANAQAQALTRYMGSFGVGVESATESEVQIPMPACTIRNLRAVSNAAPAAGQTIIQTVMKNGVATAVTCTITGTPSIRVAADTTNSVVFAAGDLFSIQDETSATSGTRTVTAAVEAFLT